MSQSVMPTLPDSFSSVTINGEEYMPTPRELDPSFPEDRVWTQWPPDAAFLTNPEWFNVLGEDKITQRRIWSVPTESGQLEQFRQLLHEYPDQGLEMMFAAAVKGKPHILRFLLSQGVKATAKDADDDDMTATPLHAAAYQGCSECVRVLMEDGKVSPNAVDHIGGTPLMRACWGAHPEIVRYLLDAGADVTTRQSEPAMEDDDALGTNALEFAAGAGCFECVKLVLERAKELGIDTTGLITPVALAAAGAGDNLEMLTKLLEIAGYPGLPQDGVADLEVWEGEADGRDDGSSPPLHLTLTDQMMDTVERTFARAVESASRKTLAPLLTYIIRSRRPESTEYHWTALKDSTFQSLADAIISYARHSDTEEHEKALALLLDLVLSPESRFTATKPEIRRFMHIVLKDAFFFACQYDRLNIVRLLTENEKYAAQVDVNHLARGVAPAGTTPLYTAAGSGNYRVLEFLLAEYGERLDVHKGSGGFANGPTALWIAVWNANAGSVRLLLEERGGPVDSIDEGARPRKLGEEGKEQPRVGEDVVRANGDGSGEGERAADDGSGEERRVVGYDSEKEKAKLIVTATKTHRSPVRLISEAVWTGSMGKSLPETGNKGFTADESGHQLHFVILELEEADAVWWHKLTIRKSDGELLSQEVDGRPLKEEE
ncbi:MAG: hypothetical protein M1831_002167 [Alyxoria varia]|nr:MAG: hypothetical protein M1831_002167 [Alyxoria varia]